jgi:hypothetical protein
MCDGTKDWKRYVESIFTIIEGFLLEKYLDLDLMTSSGQPKDLLYTCILNV